MEELQDAIEDAQYMNAMHDDVPRPTKEWVRPTPEELQAYMNRIRVSNAKALELEGICQGSLGLYYFTKFVITQGSPIHGEFLLDVASFRARAASNVFKTAKTISKCFLAEGSTGLKDIKETYLPLLSRNLAPELESFSTTWTQFTNFEAPINSLGVFGEVLTKVTSVVDIIKLNSSDNPITPTKPLDKHIFDEIDAVVFYFLKDRYFTAFKTSPMWTKYFEMMSLTEKKVCEDDFSLFRVLGRGGFGLVNGCKRCNTGKLYAMKMMNKKRVKMKKAEALCQNERNILTVIDSPYVVCLKYAFSTPNDLYLILDLMIGGDLGFHLARKGRFSDREAKYYSARTLLGIGALHEQRIVYRDLKPENILMDEDGRTRISDLGLACKVGRSGLSGTCGTRGYWAPEMLRRDAAGKRERYSLSVDWFSFGCCVYEFMYGVSPFRTERARQWGDFPKIEKADKDKAIDLAINEMEPDFDETFDSTARNLIQRLLVKDGTQRLGANGYKEVMAHPWFADVDWDNLNYCPAPMRPAKDINMATQSEIGTFADEKNSKKIELTEADQKLYEAWEFISIKSFQDEVVEFLKYEEIVGPIKPMNSGQACCTIS